MIYRTVLFRILTFIACLGFLLLFLSLFEAAYFIGHEGWSQWALCGVAVFFLLCMLPLIGRNWSWRKYGFTSLILSLACAAGYLVLRPEYWKKDVALTWDAAEAVCPLTLDRYFYRAVILKDDPARTSRIENLEDLCRAVKFTSLFSDDENLHGQACPTEPEKRLECFVGLVHRATTVRPIGPLSQMAIASVGMKLALATQRSSGSFSQTILALGKVSTAQLEVLRAWINRPE